MQDPRATQILTDISRLLEKKPLADLKQCQAFVEQGTSGDPAFEPSSKSDTIARFYMRKAVLALIATHASDSVSEQWITENKKKLSEQYTTMSSRAGHCTDLMEMDALIVGPSSALITCGFVLAGYGNALPAKLFAALAMFCLAICAGILLNETLIPKEQRIKPTSLSILARNFLLPNSRLDFDSRLLGQLDKEVDTLLDNVKKAHGKKLA